MHWGKGFATEVIGGVINYLFEEKNADVVEALNEAIGNKADKTSVVTLNTPQTITGKKKFEAGIELIDNEINGRIYTATNNTGMLGAENQHLKIGYINDVRANVILPVLKEFETGNGGLQNTSGTGSIGTENYRWLKGYFKDINAKNIEIDGKNVATEENIPTKISQLENDSNFATEEFVDEKVASSGGGVSEEEVLNIIEENSVEASSILIGKSSNYDITNDSQIPTTKAVSQMIENAINSVLEAEY